MATWRGCEIPEDLFYDVDHDVWARLERDGEVTLGMTDAAQTRCGKLVHIQFKKVGRHLARGRSAATIESAKWVGPFATPVEGTIAATNQGAFGADVLIANRDPYGAGWLVRLVPDDWARDAAELVTGERAVSDYHARIDSLGLQCLRCAD